MLEFVKTIVHLAGWLRSGSVRVGSDRDILEVRGFVSRSSGGSGEANLVVKAVQAVRVTRLRRFLKFPQLELCRSVGYDFSRLVFLA